MLNKKCPICDRTSTKRTGLCDKHDAQRAELGLSIPAIIRWVAAKARAHERSQMKKGNI